MQLCKSLLTGRLISKWKLINTPLPNFHCRKVCLTIRRSKQVILGSKADMQHGSQCSTIKETNAANRKRAIHPTK